MHQVTLELLTPLRVKKYGDYQASGARLEFATLIDLLLSRIEALSLFHCGDRLGAEHGPAGGSP